MRHSSVCSPLRQTIDEAIDMVSISNKDWTDFVAEVRSRLDVIDANIANNRDTNDIQHKQLRDDFVSMKKEITGTQAGSLASRVRSLEDTRTKMNGVQLGLSMAFSVVTGVLAYMFGGHPNLHSLLNDVSLKFYAVTEWAGNLFGRRS